MSAKPRLYTCKFNNGGSMIHPCHRAHQALRDAGIKYETEVYPDHKALGLFTRGTRPELKKLSGQEKLPVLALPDGSTVNGSGSIVRWARRNARG